MKTDLSFSKILMGFFAFIAGMILVRHIHFNGHAFVFIIWNLFLAWIPFAISASFKKLETGAIWKQLTVFFIWLLFFPNALYIVTDLIHLEMETVVPKWFDAVLLFSSCITGLLMAFVSLLRVEHFLSKRFDNTRVHALMVIILFASSFGVYLGRFLRWNSWDVINHPMGLMFSIGQRVIFPLDHLQTWGITVMLTVLFYLLYQAVKCQDGFKPSDT